MSDKKIEVKEGTETLTILEGKALDPINLKGYQINGNISAVGDFLSKRKDTVNQKTSHIEVDLQKGNIILIVDADSPLSVKVTAALYRPDYLKTFDVNGDKTYSLKELGEMLRKHRFLFANIEEHNTVMGALLNFKAKVETEVEENRNPSNSSKRSVVDKKVDVQTQKFKVKTPLYVGGEEKTFMVEACCDVTDGSTIFWLESIDLIELERDARKEILETEIAKLQTEGYAIIQK